MTERRLNSLLSRWCDSSEDHIVCVFLHPGDFLDFLSEQEGLTGPPPNPSKVVYGFHAEVFPLYQREEVPRGSIWVQPLLTDQVDSNGHITRKYRSRLR